MIGIYAIKRIDTDEIVYVGSSTDIERRVAAHFTKFRRGKGINPSLQEIYNDIGEDLLTWVVLEIVDVSLLEEKEQEYIDAFESTTNMLPAFHAMSHYPDLSKSIDLPKPSVKAKELAEAIYGVPFDEKERLLKSREAYLKKDKELIRIEKHLDITAEQATKEMSMFLLVLNIETRVSFIEGYIEAQKRTKAS